ncbi:hypothetical protein O9K51_01723 [Purpureocillium lavendulum]|uniref:Transmembrane protein n=1 Tax=Purpureocillium lavendulum TaxID=1247861 RepID=A0AB34G6Q3_9HYPO|nr:hypothetical protein O9K51_01723 [Purpureocillium lavendulum]
MRRAVLTSSEVSVLASITIGTCTRIPTRHMGLAPTLVLCTLALFLSGYAIQQRTLRDLRAAIRPRDSRPSPKAHLPDRFRTSTTELEDGTVVLIESDADKEAKEVEQLVSTAHIPAQDRALPKNEPSHEPEKQRQQQSRESRNKDTAHVSERQHAIIAQLQADVAAKSWGVEHPDPLKKSKIPITRAERRRLIKEEIQRLAQSEQRVYYQRRLW